MAVVVVVVVEGVDEMKVGWPDGLRRDGMRSCRQARGLVIRPRELRQSRRIVAFALRPLDHTTAR